MYGRSIFQKSKSLDRYFHRTAKQTAEIKLIKTPDQVTSGPFPHLYLTSMTESLSIAEVARQQHVVVYFFPGDLEGLKYPELQGCTPQAYYFKQAIEQFEKLNTKVFGISFESSARQTVFYRELCLNYSLLSDSSMELARKLKLPIWESAKNEIYPARQTYIISAGNSIHKVIPVPHPFGHVEDVLNEVRKMVTGQRVTCR